MPTAILTPVKGLTIDLENYRTIEQPDETKAIQAMISTSPDWFWALTKSLLDDGYLPTENIIVLKQKGKASTLVVKEGNRRIAAMKLIHGFEPLKAHSSMIPKDILDAILAIPESWKKENAKIPCTIYPWSDAATVDKIVTLAHGKGEKAGRDHWNTVARARHNRNANHAQEAGLDLLEKYLIHGKNHTSQQAARWAGDYNLSVLDEAMKRGASRLGASSSPDLAKKYPKIKHKTALDGLIKDIGTKKIGFYEIRNTDFLKDYGLPPIKSTTTSGSTSNSSTTTSSNSSNSSSNSAASGAGGRRKTGAVAADDPKSVARTLRKFIPRGNGREKVVTIRDEMKRLNLKHNPLAFCFLLRSIFEVSAKAYCQDHKSSGLSITKNGYDRPLAEVLDDITNHLTKNNKDQAMLRALHGAKTQLTKSDGILSVTSMNQLVHNQRFSVREGDISVLFNNIFPLLEAMNS